ncbi:MAG: hypothetical protein V4549_18045 [Bacteroidota bacterium]
MKIEVEEKSLVATEKDYDIRIRFGKNILFFMVTTVSLGARNEFVSKIKRADFGTKLTTSEKKLVKREIEKLF